MTDKLDLKTPDMVNLNIERIAALFPRCVTETIVDSRDGARPVSTKKIDFDLLRQELSADIVEGPKERYGLEWPGKREAIVTANMPTTNTLRPVREDSVNFDTTENLYIEGDNLEVLKLLQESYLGKVKMIYIDPPYNTGNDFVYNDKFSKQAQESNIESGLIDEDGNRLVANDPLQPNPESAARYHSDWLTMMYPRLKLARNLLTDNGVIFIHIDDNEVHNLRKMCDEVFGDNNFCGAFIVKSTPNARNYGHIAKMHEYCLMYSKDSEFTITNEIEEEDKEFKYSDSIGGFNTHPLYNSDESFHIKNRPNLYYPFYLNPNSVDKDGHYQIALEESIDFHIKVYPPLSTKNKVQFVWRWSKDKASENLNDEILGYKTDDEYRIVRKMRHTSKIIRSMFLDKEYSGRRGTAEVEEIFGNKLFSFPKPISFLKDLLEMGSNQDSIILDFFSGSATTAHAVMQLNSEDGGNRKFIMVQLPEKTDEKSEAYKAGYQNICEIGKERIRRAGKKLTPSNSPEGGEQRAPNLFDDTENAQLLSYGEVGRGIDIGFRVYRLDTSYMQDVYYRPQD